MFIDADDNIHPKKVEITKYFLEKYHPNALVHSYIMYQKRSAYTKTPINYKNAEVTTNKKIHLHTFKNPAKRNRARELCGGDVRIKVAPIQGYYKVTHGYPTVKRSIFKYVKYTNMRRGEDCVFLRDILWKLGGIIHVNLKILNYRPVNI